MSPALGGYRLPSTAPSTQGSSEGLERLSTGPRDPGHFASLKEGRKLTGQVLRGHFALVEPSLPFLASFSPLARIMGKGWQQCRERSHAWRVASSPFSEQVQALEETRKGGCVTG